MSSSVFLASNFSDPLQLHREALKQFRHNIEEGHLEIAMTGLSGMFQHIERDLRSIQILEPIYRQLDNDSRHAHAKFKHIFGVSLLPTALVPLMSSILPPLEKRELEPIVAPYRHILADGYYLAGRAHGELRQFHEAARAFGRELEQLTAIHNRTEEHFVRVVDSFSRCTWSMVQNLELDSANQHLSRMKELFQPWAYEISTVARLKSFTRECDQQQEYIDELKGISRRISTLASACRNRAFDNPQDIVDNVDGISVHVQQRKAAGDVFPDILADRLALLKGAGFFLAARQDGRTDQLNERAEMIAGMCDKAHTDEARSYLRVFLNAIRSQENSLLIDASAYIVTPPSKVAPRFVRETSVVAAADTAHSLFSRQQYAEAVCCYRWVKEELSHLNLVITPMAAVVRLNTSDAAFRQHDVSRASVEAAAAHKVADLLIEKTSRPEFTPLDGHALLRMARCEHFRACRTPDLVTELFALASGERKQIWAYETLPKLRALSMETAWEAIHEMFREVTGSDRPLAISGKGVPGLRLPLEAEEVCARLFNHYRRASDDYYRQAGARLTKVPGMADLISDSRRGLAKHTFVEHDFEPFAMPAEFTVFS